MSLSNESDWGEFEGNPPDVSQAMLREYMRLGNRVRDIVDSRRRSRTGPVRRQLDRRATSGGKSRARRFRRNIGT